MLSQLKTVFWVVIPTVLLGGLLIYISSFRSIRPQSITVSEAIIDKTESWRNTKLEKEHKPSRHHQTTKTPTTAKTESTVDNNVARKLNLPQILDPFYQKKFYSLGKTRNGTDNNDRLGCHIPLLDPWDKGVRKIMDKKIKTQAARGPYNCQGVPLLFQVSKTRQHVLLDNTRFKEYKSNASDLTHCKVATFSLDYISARWRDISDIKHNFSVEIPEDSDAVFIGCSGNIFDGKKFKPKIDVGSQWKYRQLLLRLTANGKQISAKLEGQKSNKKRRLSVLMFYNDGVSHLMSRRVMNKTYYYLMNERKGVALNGYHSVGKNTFPNMTPLLTGYHINELPEYKKKYFNEIAWPFVWYNFSKANYVTGYAEDTAYATFEYLKKGFKQKPTDYYMKHYLRIIKNIGQCVTNRAYTHQAMLDLLDQFLTLHGDNDYFYLWFLNALSHYGADPLYRADEDYYRFFKRQFERGTFNNTLLIFGSDHGARFGSVRKSKVGKLEERLPLQIHVYPEWFRKEHQQEYLTLLNNQDSLTTAFDVHEMFLDIVNDTETDRDKRRGKNLFQNQIPRSRTCQEAGIPPEYCLCRDIQPLSTTSPFTKAAVETAVKHVNSLLIPHKNLCAEVVLNKIIDSQISKGTANNIDSKMKPCFNYIVTFETMPYHAQFEATVRRFNESTDYQVVGQPTRISLYGDTAYCMDDAELRNYCYCKVQRNSQTQQTSTNSGIL